MQRIKRRTLEEPWCLFCQAFVEANILKTHLNLDVVIINKWPDKVPPKRLLVKD